MAFQFTKTNCLHSDMTERATEHRVSLVVFLSESEREDVIFKTVCS